MNAMKKGNANCDALARDRLLIDRVLQEQGVRASCDYIASADNPEDGFLGKTDSGMWISRGVWGTPRFCEGSRGHFLKFDRSYWA
ncbi:hypothetical protein ERJ75_000834400 [Trypanosoma vivax]|nr:hypothetical protein ERJ75_000834400 [Trypanosoma vivax]